MEGLPGRTGAGTERRIEGGRHRGRVVRQVEAGAVGEGVAADRVDRFELEVGRRVAGPVRVALQVDTVDEATSAATAGGASLVAAAVDTPWGSRNSRLDAPGDLHVTLFVDRTPTSEG